MPPQSETDVVIMLKIVMLIPTTICLVLCVLFCSDLKTFSMLRALHRHDELECGLSQSDLNFGEVAALRHHAQCICVDTR